MLRVGPKLSNVKWTWNDDINIFKLKLIDQTKMKLNFGISIRCQMWNALALSNVPCVIFVNRWTKMLLKFLAYNSYRKNKIIKSYHSRLFSIILNFMQISFFFDEYRLHNNGNDEYLSDWGKIVKKWYQIHYDLIGNI